MGYASQQGRAKVSSRSPQAAGQCDRCGFLYTHATLRWQFDWAGASLINKRMLVCNSCYDAPQEQLRAITIPADPMPIMNPRVPDYVTAETNNRYTSGQNTVDPNTGIPVWGGDNRITQDDDNRVTQQTGEPPGGLNQEPGTDPVVPAEAGGDDPGLPYNNEDVPKTGPLYGE